MTTMKPTRDDADWRELIDAALARRGGRTGISIALHLPPDLAGFVLAAAESRGGMSLSSYVRRSALAVAAHDLELPWQTVIAKEPRVRMMDQTGRPYSSSTGPGEGFGPWLIPEMGEYRP